MRWIAEINEPKPLIAVIDKERFYNVYKEYLDEYYIYIYQNREMTHDYLQDTFEIAKKKCAWEEFQVPEDAWQLVINNPRSFVFIESPEKKYRIVNDLVLGCCLMVHDSKKLLAD